MCIVYKEELLFEAGWIWIRQNPKVRVLIGREDFVPDRDKTKKDIFIQPSCGQTHLHHGGLTLVIRLFTQVESKLI